MTNMGQWQTLTFYACYPSYSISHFVILQIEYNGKLYDVEIVDTAGQEEFSSFRDSSVATGDAFLVLFAINSTSSWHELKDLRSKIIQDRQLSSVIPMVIVANKLVSWIVLFLYKINLMYYRINKDL